MQAVATASLCAPIPNCAPKGLSEFESAFRLVILRPRSLRRVSRRVLLQKGPGALAPLSPRVAGARARSGSQSCWEPAPRSWRGGSTPAIPPPPKRAFGLIHPSKMHPQRGAQNRPQKGALNRPPEPRLESSSGGSPGAPRASPRSPRPPPPPPDSLQFFPNVAPTLVQYFAFLGGYLLELDLGTIIFGTASIRRSFWWYSFVKWTSGAKVMSVLRF